MDVSEQQQRHGRFWKKYLRLTRAGVGTLRALEVIQAEESDDDFRTLIGSLLQTLTEGQVLSHALGQHPEVFSLTVREMILTAERNGHWDLVIEELADGLLEGTFA